MKATELELTAYLDNEMTAEERAAIEAELQKSESLRAKLAMLQAARRALHVHQGIVPGAAGRQRSDRSALWLGLLAMAAAVAVVCGLYFGGSGDDPAADAPRRAHFIADEGDHGEPWGKEAGGVRLRVTMPKGTELLGDGEWTLEMEVGDDPVLLAAPFPGGQVYPEGVAEMVEVPEIWPRYLKLEIASPDGRMYSGYVYWRDEPMQIKNGKKTFTFSLSAITCSSTDAPMYWSIAPVEGGKGGWKISPEGHPNYPRPEGKEEFGTHLSRPFIPIDAGKYTITVSLADMHPMSVLGHYKKTDREIPAHEEPSSNATVLQVAGVAGEWGDELNGLQCRVATPKARYKTGECVPMIVQFRNNAQRARKYNFVGTSAAENGPQPFHFAWLVNGGSWETGHNVATDNSDPIIAASDLFYPQQPGAWRTVVVPLEWWLLGDTALNQKAGELSLGCYFAFKPTIWDGADLELWMGTLSAPAIQFELK